MILSGRGIGPDADMLPVGHLSMATALSAPTGSPFHAGRTAHPHSLWSLLPSPLMVGANLPDNDDWTMHC